MTRALFLGLTILAATALRLAAQELRTPGSGPVNLLNPGSPPPAPAGAAPAAAPQMQDAAIDTQPVPGSNTAASDTPPGTMTAPARLSAAPTDGTAPLPEMQVQPRPGEGKGTLQ